MKNYKKKPKEFLTMFLCSGCNDNLNSAEAYNGDKCNACIAKERGLTIALKPQVNIFSADKKVLEILAQWAAEPEQIILADNILVNYIGKPFFITVVAGKDMIPYAIIKAGGVIIYADGTGHRKGKRC